MKIKDLLKLSFVNFTRNRKNIHNIWIVILCTLLSLFSLTILVSFHSYIDNHYDKNIDFRTLNVSSSSMQNIDESIDMDRIKQIDHVIEVLDSKYVHFTANSNLESSQYNGIIKLTAVTPNLPVKISKGENIGSKRNVAVCPENFYPDSSAADFHLSLKNRYDENLIGKTFKIKYAKYDMNSSNHEAIQKYSKEFEIVGLYNISTNMTSANQCYISLEDMKEIVDVARDNQGTFPYVFVDSFSNVKQVMEELNHLGYSASVNSEFDQTMIHSISLICNIISISSLFVAVILLILYIKKMILDETQTIGIFRSFGYTRKNVRIYYLMEIFLPIFFTYLWTIFLFAILSFLLKMVTLNVSNLYSIQLVIHPVSYLITLVIMVFIPYIISIFYLFKTTNKNILTLIRSEE